MPKSKFEAQYGSSHAVLRHWREAVPNDRLAHLIKDAMRGVSRALQMRLMEHSVSFGHWTFLRILWENDGLTQRQLSEEAGLMDPTTHSALRAMEKLGYISRRKLPNNNKNIHIYLTPKGRALKKVLVPIAEEVNNIAVNGVSESAIQTTRKTLLAIIENLALDEQESLQNKRHQPSTRDLSDLINIADAAEDVR
ncbi:MarR family winged helix-turn-helix transcriptional regulator [Pollutimonas sp. M17]|uniref:MarR family winged helix-turn-helix transcriptional regulator n=1 Tax=Pollutimonas sp. M17 TaxID=2962065 RepID=UPI0021F49996|nr:MarR family transcriptional regulator [Pollutimonas sp. M17]UYO94415.1 MarR family transcriptional regulator [Pollutimonas sp. M17]HWK71070.1 MarR family transcriptional regulator [Burkholderiaceae bacterium]